MNSCCPLCAGGAVQAYDEDARRQYCQCRSCHLVFVPPAFYLSPAEEKAQYDLHENHPQDPDYRRFLSRLTTPLAARLAPGARGLDFGSGPGPTLSLMLQEAGFVMALYDPFFAPDTEVLDRSYDFITCTEVVEHLHQPGRVLQQLYRLLAPGGWLGLMTKLVRDRQAFHTWHYKNDPTHVCFWSRDTFHWLARHHGWQVEFAAADVILLQKIAQP